MAEQAKKSKFFDKLKSIKHIEVVVIVVFAACLLLIIFNSFGSGKSGGDKEDNVAIDEYARGMEVRMAEVLSRIDGAGAVSVMITFESSAEIVPATETDRNDNTSIVIVGGKPVIITEIQPKVLGVIVVAEGASNIKVKLDLLKAVQTLLDIEQSRIEIFSMVKKKA